MWRVFVVWVLALSVGACSFHKSMGDIRAQNPVFSAVTAMSVEQFSSCFILYMEEETGTHPTKYFLRQFEDRTEIISDTTMGSISFILIAVPEPNGSSITLREGFSLEIKYATEAIHACGGYE
ncbi:MAG: hypothetical protein IID51_03300 [Proteobacteria bacterium]|nr:hypothetical protein [Pseudomonadota bacterium]